MSTTTGQLRSLRSSGLKDLSLAVFAQNPLEHLKDADALNTSIQSEESTTTREGITGDHLKGLAGAEAKVFAHWLVKRGSSPMGWLSKDVA